MYLGVTEIELDVSLMPLEKHLQNDEITRRIDALTMAFSKQKAEGNSGRLPNFACLNS